MSGYFSQLIGQTGIVLPQQNVLDQNVVSDIFSAESSGEDAPIQEEHVEVIVPQADGEVRESDRSIKPLQKTNSKTGETPIPQEFLDRSIKTLQKLPSMAGETPTPQELLEGSVISATISDVSEIASVSPTVQPEAGELRAIAPNQEPTILETIEVHSFSESIPVSQPSQSKEIKSNKDVENTSPLIADRPLNITEPEPIESVQVESKLAVTKSPKTPVAPPTRQAYLQAVRDWVAGKPREIEEIQESSSQQDAQSTAMAANRQPAPVPFALESSRQSNVQPPQEQDFVLSIGSIHLTIAAPQPETLPPPVVIPQNSQNVKPEYSASRLSRYYLRLR